MPIGGALVKVLILLCGASSKAAAAHAPYARFLKHAAISVGDVSARSSGSDVVLACMPLSTVLRIGIDLAQGAGIEYQPGSGCWLVILFETTSLLDGT